MDAKEAAMGAKRYFKDTKTLTKFIFETVSEKRDAGRWMVFSCTCVHGCASVFCAPDTSTLNYWAVGQIPCHWSSSKLLGVPASFPAYSYGMWAVRIGTLPKTFLKTSKPEGQSFIDCSPRTRG